MFRGLFAFACVLVAGVAASAQTLEEKLQPIVAKHKGKIAIAVKHLETGETYYLHENDVMPTASLIKLPIMVETFRLVEEGKHTFDHKITLKKEDMVPGAGVLTDSFSPGATFTLIDAVRLMITVSDNTATNLVLDTITIPATNVTMKKLGFPETRINSKVYRGGVSTVDPERSKKYGLGSTTAKEMIGLLELIGTKKVVSEKACDEMLSILKKNQDSELIVRNLPPGAVFAHKTGAVSAARTEAGLLYVKNKPTIAICILTNENADQRWLIDNESQLILSQLGRAIYDHFIPATPAKK
jgi:beta-lactamase class A